MAKGKTPPVIAKPMMKKMMHKSKIKSVAAKAFGGKY